MTIQKNAPAYTAGADGLIAPYSLDFSADSTICIPLSGSWQGDAILARAIYVDNLNNPVIIGYNLGNDSGSIPAFSAGYISPNGAGTVVFTCQSAISIAVTILDKAKPAGFISSGINPNINIGTFTAGESLSANDLVVLGADSYLWKGGRSETVTKADAGDIVAGTNISATVFSDSSSSTKILEVSDGIIIGCDVGNLTGLQLKKYDFAGNLIGSVQLDNGANGVRCRLLYVGGKVICIWQTNTTAVNYQIFDVNLITLVNKTAISGVAAVDNWGVVYNATQFAVQCCNSVGNAVTLTVTDLNGTQIFYGSVDGASTSPTIIGTVIIDGNIGCFWTSGSDNKLYAKIMTFSGSVIVAKTIIDNQQWQTGYTNCSVFYSGTKIVVLGMQGGVSRKAWIGANDLSAAPGVVTIGGTGQLNYPLCDIFNGYIYMSDNSYIYRLDLVGNFVTLVTLPVSSSIICCIASKGKLLVIQRGLLANSPYIYSVYNIASNSFLKSAVNFGATPTSGGAYVWPIWTSDFTFATLNNFTTPAQYQVTITKAIDTAIQGVERNSAVAGGRATFDGSIGYKTINSLLGSLTKKFDHSTSNIAGRKGGLLGNTVYFN